MQALDKAPPKNLLLCSLPSEDLEAIAHDLVRKPLRDGDVLVKASDPLATVCFLEGGVASFHEVLRDGRRVGVGIAGFEGFTGWSVLLDVNYSPYEVSVAIGGETGLFISADNLLKACAERPSINKLLLRYVQCFVSQMGRTILSNLHDPIERRLARWLLMNHDRLPSDQIHLTHEQLGVMLGVRRASVTETLHILEGEQMITSARGIIRIRDRTKLMSFAGESYGVAEAEYGRTIAPFAKIPS